MGGAPRGSGGRRVRGAKGQTLAGQIGLRSAALSHTACDVPFTHLQTHAAFAAIGKIKIARPIKNACIGQQYEPRPTETTYPQGQGEKSG